MPGQGAQDGVEAARNWQLLGNLGSVGVGAQRKTWGDSKLGGGLEERKEAAELLVGGVSSSQLLAPAHHRLSLAYLWQPHCRNLDVRQEQVCCHSG